MSARKYHPKSDTQRDTFEVASKKLSHASLKGLNKQAKLAKGLIAAKLSRRLIELKKPEKSTGTEAEKEVEVEVEVEEEEKKEKEKKGKNGKGVKEPSSSSSSQAKLDALEKRLKGIKAVKQADVAAAALRLVLATASTTRGRESANASVEGGNGDDDGDAYIQEILAHKRMEDGMAECKAKFEALPTTSYTKTKPTRDKDESSHGHGHGNSSSSGGGGGGGGEDRKRKVADESKGPSGIMKRPKMGIKSMFISSLSDHADSMGELIKQRRNEGRVVAQERKDKEEAIRKERAKYGLTATSSSASASTTAGGRSEKERDRGRDTTTRGGGGEGERPSRVRTAPTAPAPAPKPSVSATALGEQHPSWVARQKAKEKEAAMSSIKAFEGTKITFDDDSD